MPYEITLGLLKPTILASQPVISEIFRTIKLADLHILQTKRIFWHEEDARVFYAEHRGRFYYDRLVLHATSGPMMALLIGGDDAIERWRALIGPAKAYKAMWTHPQTLRAIYAISDTRNGFHGSDSPAAARREMDFVFKGIDTAFLIEKATQSSIGR